MGRKDIRMGEMITGEGDDQKRSFIAVEQDGEQRDIAIVNERVGDKLIWQEWARDPNFGMSIYGPDVAPNPSTAARLNREAARRMIKLKEKNF